MIYSAPPRVFKRAVVKTMGIVGLLSIVPTPMTARLPHPSPECSGKIQEKLVRVLQTKNTHRTEVNPYYIQNQQKDLQRKTIWNILY